MLDSASIIAICTAVPVVVGTIANFVLSLRNGAKQDTIIQKSDAIHDLADGTNSKLREHLQVANQKIELKDKEIEGLHTVIAVQGTPQPKP